MKMTTPENRIAEYKSSKKSFLRIFTFIKLNYLFVKWFCFRIHP